MNCALVWTHGNGAQSDRARDPRPGRLATRLKSVHVTCAFCGKAGWQPRPRHVPRPVRVRILLALEWMVVPEYEVERVENETVSARSF